MIEQLKRFDENRTDLLEMVALSIFGKQLRAECETRNVPVAEWLDDSIRAINRAIDARTRDAKELRLKELLAQESQLLTAGEKRERIAAEKAKLVAELAGV